MRLKYHTDGPKCFHCDRQATALWTGINGSVYVCGGCAQDVLPALIADAVSVIPGPGTNGFQSPLDRAEAAYWKGAVARLNSAKGSED